METKPTKKLPGNENPADDSLSGVEEKLERIAVGVDAISSTLSENTKALVKILDDHETRIKATEFYTRPIVERVARLKGEEAKH